MQPWCMPAFNESTDSGTQSGWLLSPFTSHSVDQSASSQAASQQQSQSPLEETSEILTGQSDVLSSSALRHHGEKE